MQLAASIFKAYDIRGIVPTTLDEDVARALGRAFGSAARAAGEQVVAVGRDGRLSGPALAAALIQGLVDTGVQVIDIGLCTTPMLYFAAATLCRSGIQITGSHNPKDYNGFKMVLAGRAIYGEEIQALRRTMEEESWQLQPGGSVRQADVLSAYRERIVGDVKLARPMKVVVDCGNGADAKAADERQYAVADAGRQNMAESLMHCDDATRGNRVLAVRSMVMFSFTVWKQTGNQTKKRRPGSAVRSRHRQQYPDGLT